MIDFSIPIGANWLIEPAQKGLETNLLGLEPPWLISPTNYAPLILFPRRKNQPEVSKMAITIAHPLKSK